MFLVIVDYLFFVFFCLICPIQPFSSFEGGDDEEWRNALSERVKQLLHQDQLKQDGLNKLRREQKQLASNSASSTPTPSTKTVSTSSLLNKKR